MEDSATLSSSEVPGAHAGLVIAKVIEGDEVALCEVEDVDVVADGGAVVGGVVYGQFCEQAFSVRVANMGDGAPTVAKDEQLLALPDRYLGKQWEEIVRYTLGIFAHDTAGMRAGRVEVAQESGVPVVAGLALFLEVVALGFDVVGDAGFDGRLGAAVRVRGANGADFGNGYHVLEAGGVAVDGGRRGEDDVGDIVTGHGGQEADGAVDIGAVVFQRDLARLAYSLPDMVTEKSQKIYHCFRYLAKVLE